MTVVEPPLKLVKVGVKVLGAEMVVGTDDRLLEEAPNALHGVSVNVAPYPFVLPALGALKPAKEPQ